MKKTAGVFAVLLLVSSFFTVNTDKLPISGERVTDVYNYRYGIDVSEYIDFIEPTGELWSNDYLILVNRENPLEKDDESSFKALSSRVTLGRVGKNEYDFRFRPALTLNITATGALTAMLKEATASGKLKSENLQVLSAYRSYASQEGVFNRNVRNTKKYKCTNADCAHEYITKSKYTKCELCGSSVTNIAISGEEAKRHVSAYSCAAGTSEHQTGLAVDIIDTTFKIELVEEFKDTEAGRWLAENCTRFGFVLRFEKDKESSTGIIYEPWHFRYVGRYHATRMKELGMCLEEYVGLLKEEGYFNDPNSEHNPANMKIDPETYLAIDKNSG